MLQVSAAAAEGLPGEDEEQPKTWRSKLMKMAGAAPTIQTMDSDSDDGDNAGEADAVPRAQLHHNHDAP